MKIALLIRTVDVDDNVLRLERELRPYFGDNIYFMLDRYSDAAAPALDVEEKNIRIGRAYLNQNGLPYFPRVGWQCGDFVFYAASDALPDFDDFWLIEPDVHFSLDIVNFFTRMEAIKADLLGAAFGCRTNDWVWHKTMSAVTDVPIYGLAYPVVRLSRKAIVHLKSARIKYSATDYAAEKTYINSKAHLYANDEAFTATILKRDGFKCQSLHAVAGDVLEGYFHTNFPVLPEEVSTLAGKIAHPVCNIEKSRQNFTKLMKKPEQHAHRIHKRMQEIIKNFGEDTWIRCSQIQPDYLRDIVAALPQQGMTAAFIRGRQRKSDWTRSNADDFLRHPPVPFEAPDFTRILPYAADYRAQRVTFVDTDPRQLNNDPFLFLSQYRHATYAVDAYLTHLPDTLEPTDNSRITFIFSIGRCGSTLTTNLAKAAGMIVYSECDALIGLPNFNRSTRMPRVEQLLRRIVGALGVYAGGTPVVIKMKSWSNHDIAWFSHCFPDARFVFLSRALEPWAASFIQVFNWNCERLLETLVSGVRSHQHLKDAGQLKAFLRYEDLVDDPIQGVANLFGAAPTNETAARIIIAASQESQSGLLKKGKVPGNEVSRRISELRQCLSRADLGNSDVVYG